MRGSARRLDPNLASTLQPLLCLWNPDNFDPVSYLGGRCRDWSDLARFLVHKIIWSNVFRGADSNGFVPLKAAYLRPFFPNTDVYREVMNRLTEGGAIVTDGRYIPGEKCFGYKLGPELATTGHRRTVITDHLLAKKVARHRAEFPKTLKGVQRHLYGHLGRLEIDRDAAADLLFEEGFNATNQTAIEFIHGKEFHLKVCEFGRVHTNLTNLKSEFRRFLSVGGSPLVNLDIRNSQPLIFASLLKQRYEFNPDQTTEPVPPDVLRYVDLVQAGQFYDYLMDESGMPPESRGVFKKNFFKRVFFCKNNYVTPAAEAFGDLFPSVYSVILKEKADDYADLARSLQKAESAIMIGGVATRCMNELPQVFIGTIHDSILTTPAYAEAIKAIMLEEFRKVELRPTINAEVT